MLLAAEESNTVERKASLHHLHGPLPLEIAGRVEAGKLSAKEAEKPAQDGIRKAVTKTIAAFLNSHGGTLLVGVTDLATLWASSRTPYVEKQKQNADGWLLSFRNIMVAALEADVSSMINVKPGTAGRPSDRDRPSPCAQRGDVAQGEASALRAVLCSRRQLD